MAIPLYLFNFRKQKFLMKHQKFIIKIILLGLIICNIKPGLSQEDGLLNKTKSQIKLTETKQLFLQGNIKTALLNYKEIIALNPSNAKAHFGIARCYYKLHNYNQSKYHAEIAEKNNPKADEDLHYLMGEIYFRLGELNKSRNNYEKFISEINSKQKIKDFSVDLKLNQLAFAEKEMLNMNKEIIISNMGSTLNSKGSDFAPSLSNNGKYLMFTSRRADTKGGNVDQFFDHQYFSDIYLSKWDSVGRKWLTPSNKLGRINTDFHDASLSFKADNSIIIYRNIPYLTRSGDIYEAAYTKSGSWATPKPILNKDKKISNKINSSYFESSASITEDESYIYFVSERPSGLGKTDIYYVKKTGKTYSEPNHLGDEINTSGDEKCVFIHPSGDLLFFTSNGRKESIGSYDIYYCTGGHDNWSKPVNLGTPINTHMEEKTICVSKDGNTAYVGGYYNIDNMGDADLYQIDISRLKLISK